MKNAQISFDEKLLREIDRVAASSRKTRSAIVREAVKVWLNQKQIRDFEERWIAKLRENPQDATDSEAWANAESWEDE
jgi:metal-responsive CopG/Arc/MetJ family transcriptional regulator